MRNIIMLYYKLLYAKYYDIIFKINTLIYKDITL
jgi:hypothetical protein